MKSCFVLWPKTNCCSTVHEIKRLLTVFLKFFFCFCWSWCGLYILRQDVLTCFTIFSNNCFLLPSPPFISFAFRFLISLDFIIFFLFLKIYFHPISSFYWLSYYLSLFSMFTFSLSSRYSRLMLLLYLKNVYLYPKYLPSNRMLIHIPNFWILIFSTDPWN